MFDFCFVLITSVITIVILSVVFHAWFALGYLFVVLILFGLTSLLTSYVVSLFAKSQLAAFAFSAGSQAIMFVVYIVTYISILTNISSANIDPSVNLAHYLLAIVMPPASLGRALLVALNTFSISCDGSTLVSYPGNINAYGGPILYLLCQSFILFGFLVWWDSGLRLTGVRERAQLQHHEEAELADTDILSEVRRVTNSEDTLRVLHASKAFNRRRVVDDVTFGVAQNEVLALLGPNGAGKTTLMGLIRGELKLSEGRGDVLVGGASLRKDLTSVRSHLGFCPQFDAIDAMTVTEHLQLYARIKGVRNTNTNVDHILQLMGLVPFANRLGAELPGGYKRRLSLGIALIGENSKIDFVPR
jgi:ATP-binding cassette, subfamily A (ABC1), member 3